MNLVIIASAVIAATVVVGSVLASAFVRLSSLVAQEVEASEREKSSFNPTVTMGHKIPVEADFETQLREARKLAARRAAALPRGANLGIGRYGVEKQLTAFDGIADDPVSAVKIAGIHGWQILRTGATVGVAADSVAAQPASVAVAPVKSPKDLVPGKDYPFIEITDDMAPADKRKARIANAKARTAAIKALKEAAAVAPPPVVGEVATTAVPERAPLEASPVPGTASAPVAGVDYPVIEITDEMSPADVRTARIANAKARSAALKAFKEAGGAAAQAEPIQPAAAPEADTPAQDVAPESTQAAVAADIPSPDYIEITEDMDAAEVREARIHNAKARSAYHKALKAAGIDPAQIDR